jgi:hypothetical protein
MFNPTFNYCLGNIKNATTQGFITAEIWLDRIRNPKPGMVQLIEKIRSTTNETDKAILKAKLPSVTPAVLMDKGVPRSYKSIKDFTGIMMVDFDKISYADQFREYLFIRYPFIIATWLSSSGKGVRGMVKVPKCKDTDEFKMRFTALQKLLGVYDGFDSAPKNSVLPLFYSIDKYAFVDLERTEIFREYYIEPTQECKPVDWRLPDNNKSKFAYLNIQKAIDKITDNGHPQLRAAAYSLGGYVAAGYIAYNDAIDYINQLIESNKYLSQKKDVYKTTAKTMINKGQSEPLTI